MRRYSVALSAALLVIASASCVGGQATRRVRVVIEPNATPDEVHRVWSEVLGKPTAGTADRQLRDGIASVKAADGEGGSAVLIVQFSRGMTRRKRDSLVAQIRSSPLVARVDADPRGNELSWTLADASAVAANLVGLGWLTLGWLIFLFPITLTVSIVSILLGAKYHWRRTSSGEEAPMRWHWLAPTAVTLIILIWGAFFLTPDTESPPVIPWYAYAILVLLLAEAGVSLAIVASARDSRQLAVAAVLPQLWIGALASFIAVWGVTAGGTLGAL